MRTNKKYTIMIKLKQIKSNQIKLIIKPYIFSRNNKLYHYLLKNIEYSKTTEAEEL